MSRNYPYYGKTTFLCKTAAEKSGPVEGRVIVGNNIYYWKECPECKELRLINRYKKTCSYRCGQLYAVETRWLSMECRYIAVDPGNNIGWAKFDEEGTVMSFGELKGHDVFLDWFEDQLEKGKVSVVIVEAYRARPGATNAWSKLPTIQLIGAIKRVARKNHVRVVEQDPNPGLSIGLRFIGMHNTYKGKGKHVPDKVSALAHGTYFLRKEGILK